jgi:hypothetical protein
MTQVTTTRHPHYLLVEISGTIRTVKDVVEYTAVFRPEAERLGVRRVLLDYVQSTFGLDYHDLREVAEIGVRREFPGLGLRIAVVCRPEELDLHRQFETIAVNRSIIYRVFTDTNEALDWLLAL